MFFICFYYYIGLKSEYQKPRREESDKASESAEAAQVSEPGIPAVSCDFL